MFSTFQKSNFQNFIKISSACVRAPLENYFCQKSRISDLSQEEKNQAKILFSHWYITLFQCTCWYGHQIKVIFKHDIEQFINYTMVWIMVKKLALRATGAKCLHRPKCGAQSAATSAWEKFTGAKRSHRRSITKKSKREWISKAECYRARITEFIITNLACAKY